MSRSLAGGLRHGSPHELQPGAALLRLHCAACAAALLPHHAAGGRPALHAAEPQGADLQVALQKCFHIYYIIQHNII